jgi:uncharacterized protein
MQTRSQTVNDVSYKSYRVIGKNRESDTITSIVLSPVDGGDVPAFKAGQYLTLKIGSEVIRTYTISSSPSERKFYRITVKREPSKGDGFPVGRASAYIHDELDVGSSLEVLGPRGDFFLDESTDRPVLLVSGGVGITPMVSMLHALADGSRQVNFAHACENGLVHALYLEVDELSRRRGGVKSYYAYRTPTDSDRTERRYQTEGVLTPDVVKSLLLPDCKCYVCGPPGFMKAMYDTLRSLGVAKTDIHYEFFGPATVLEPETTTEVGGATEVTVVFKGSKKTAAWENFSGTILEFAEANGLSPSAGCRAGICGTCECSLLSGEIAYITEPLDIPAPGRMLPCIARPMTKEVEIDL